MQNKKITICNKLGLHARAATKLASVATRFSCQIQIGCNDKEIDAKSIMSLMLLAASKGTMIEVTTQGDDEIEALNAIVCLVEDKFGEGE